MREHYDFSDAIKNPFAGKKEKGKFNVLVTYDEKQEGNEPKDKKLINNEIAKILAEAL